VREVIFKGVGGVRLGYVGERGGEMISPIWTVSEYSWWRYTVGGGNGA